MDAKAVLLSHGEKVAIGLAVIISIAGYFLLFGGESVNPAELDELANDVRARRSDQTLPPVPDIDSLPDIQAQWSKVPTPQPLPPWAMHRKYYILRDLEKAPEIPLGEEPVLLEPALSIAERGTDFITLAIEAGVNLEEKARVTGLLLYRTSRTDSDGNPEFPPQEYQKLPADGSEFEDRKDIKPRQKVFYKVVSMGQVTGPQAFADGQDSKESEVLSVQVPANVYIQPLSTTPRQILAKVPSKAFLKVVIWDPDARKWIDEDFSVEEGEDIGKLVQIMGAANRDFRTGFRLVEAGTDTKEVLIGGVKVKKAVKWIKVQEIANPDAKPEKIEDSEEFRDAIKLRLDNREKLIPEESGGGESGDEEEAPGDDAGDEEEEE